MTFVKAGTEALRMKKAVMKQLSRENSLIGNGRENVRERFDTFSPTSCWSRGGNPTTVLLDVRVINIGLAINWSNMMYWRHVVLTGLRKARMLRMSAISHLQMRPNDASAHATG